MKEIYKALFDKHHVRKNKAQKSEFIEYIEHVSQNLGYPCRTEKASFGGRNIVIGNPERARVVYTAHYDTCARLPFPNFITPKNIGIYIIYQIILTAAMLLPMFAVSFGVGYLLGLTSLDGELVGSITFVLSYLTLILTLVLMIAGPANKHTANDNTSGVATVLSIMESLPRELRDKAAFILFDLEEAGLIGSSSYLKAHKKEMENTLLINFDCVSDGKNMLFALKKGAALYKREIREAFAPDGCLSVEVLDKGVFYPSDQMGFPLGVGVAALKKTESGLLYMDRIHTGKDTVFEEDNIEFLTRGAIKLTEMM